MACPICNRPTEKKFRPFCSKRCADVDLGRWFSGGYALPAGPEDEDALPSEAPDRDHDGSFH